MKYLANAKINIRLNVLGKNENDYHNLSMINAKISLADEIEITIGSENKVNYSVEELNHLENDLCLNVLNEITTRFSIKEKYNIYIKKNIPMGAGLGGGSSDVACIINALDKIHNLNLTLEEKINIGIKYGADVPYCLIDNLALVEGIGEKLTLFDTKLRERVVVVYPNIFVSTKEVFKKVKKYSDSVDKKEIEKYILNKEYEKILFNDLEEPSFELVPKLKQIKENLLRVGYTIMSGSGSSMLVFIKDDKDLEKIKQTYPNFLIFDTYII